jgi:rRNA maturation endonuclease Nob1
VSPISKLLRAVGVTAESARTDTQPEQSDTPKPSLYECPACTTVYVAVEKETCSTCGTTVEQVGSTDADS